MRRNTTVGTVAGASIIVGTPGRMVDILRRTNTETLSFSSLEVLVLDEADKLLDMGFEVRGGAGRNVWMTYMFFVVCMFCML